MLDIIIYLEKIGDSQVPQVKTSRHDLLYLDSKYHGPV